MATNKLDRIERDIEKTKTKIAELQKQLRELEAAKTEQENLQIVQLVRGLNMTPEEFAALLDLYNRYPIACLTVHPRVRKEKYRGPVHLDVFADALANSRNPVCYNGDLRTVGEVRALEGRFPEVTHVMIGRGLVADPALARKLRGGKGTDREELTDFLAALYQGYTDFYQGQVPTAAQRMREVWFYLIHLFDDAEKLNKQLRRFRTPAEYERIQAEILASCPIRSDVQGDLI